MFGTDLVAPDILRPELANTLVKKVRRKEIGLPQAIAAYAEIEASLVFLSTDGLWQGALEIALELDHPAYDCGFLALAEATGFVIVTADRRLVDRCSGTRFVALVSLI